MLRSTDTIEAMSYDEIEESLSYEEPDDVLQRALARLGEIEDDRVRGPASTIGLVLAGRANKTRRRTDQVA